MRPASCGFHTNMARTARSCEKEHLAYLAFWVATLKCCRWFYSHNFSLSCCDMSHYVAKFSMLVYFPALYPVTLFLLILPVRRRKALFRQVCTGKSVLSAAWKDAHTCGFGVFLILVISVAVASWICRG